MIARVLMALIRVYQLTLSKLIRVTLGDVCRFEPSCSRYAFACIRDHGALRGGLLSVKRLCRCHPFHPGGFDPPPPPRVTARATSMTTFSAAATAPAGEAPVSAEKEPLGNPSAAPTKEAPEAAPPAGRAPDVSRGPGTGELFPPKSD